MTAKLLRPDELRKRRDAAWPARIQRGCTSELGGLDGHVCLMSKRGGGCTVQHDSIPGHGQKRIRDPSPCQSVSHATWAAESLFRWDLSKGPSPDQTKHTTSLGSFAGGCTLQTGSASQKKPCSHWLRCHAALGSGPLVSALRRLRFLWPPFPPFPRPPSPTRRGPRDDGMDGRDIGQGCQARNAD